MKKLYLLIVVLLIAIVAYTQPLMDTAVKLVAQKENVIKENTIVTVENLGDKINTEYPEMRPTVSAFQQQMPVLPFGINFIKAFP